MSLLGLFVNICCSGGTKVIRYIIDRSMIYGCSCSTAKKNYLTARWRPWSLPAVDGSADRLVLLLLLSKEDPRCLLPGGLVAATRGRHRGGGRGQLQPEGLCPLGAAQGTGSTPAPTAASFLCSGQNAWSFNGLLKSNPRQFECM